MKKIIVLILTIIFSVSYANANSDIRRFTAEDRMLAKSFEKKPDVDQKRDKVKHLEEHEKSRKPTQFIPREQR